VEVKQWVACHFKDKDNNLLWTYKDICFARFPEGKCSRWKEGKPLRDNVKWMTYKPHEFNVPDDVGEKWFKFFKKVWGPYHNILHGVGWKKFKEHGVTFDVDNTTAFEAYTLMVAMRSIHELVPVVKLWNDLLAVLTPVEALIAAHGLSFGDYWNSGHSLLPRTYCEPIEGAEWGEFEENFPKAYKDVSLKTHPNMFIDPEGSSYTLHNTFTRRKAKWYHAESLLRLSQKDFVRILPVKGKELYDFTKTYLVRKYDQIPVFDAV
jgi:hypothetical protein